MKKIISISLLIVLVLTTPIHANTSKGNYIIINNESTDPYTTQTTGNFQNQKNANQSNQKTSTPYAIDQVLPSPENAKLYKSKTKNNKSLETTREFTTVNFRNNKNEKIKADLKYSGKKVDIWVHENQISNAQAIRIGQEFDNNIYSLMRNNFGEESDLDNNNKINILIYDIKDNFENTNVFTQGYFNSMDLYDVEGSNNGEVLYIDTYPTMDITDSYNNQGIENLYPVIVHEFQHMISFNENAIKGYEGSLDTWIDEGLSMAAEQLYTNTPRMDRINYYNQSNSITNGHSLLYWDNNDTLSNYSLSYLFMQYLNIQADVGESIYKEIIQNPNSDYKAIEDIIKKYIDPYMSFGEFMTNFRIALTLNQSTGKYGFKNIKGFDQLQKKIYNGNEINLRGGGAVVIKANTSIEIPNDKGDNIVYVGSDDIDNEEKNHVQIIGANRYDTAAKISQKTFEDKSDAVVLINGKNSSDGLSAGPFASLINGSMLLVEKDYIPAETINEIKRLNPRNVYLIGGENVISDKIKDNLQSIIDIDNNNIKRIGGMDREETSLLIGKEIAKLSNNIENIYVVNGYKGEADAMSILSKACYEKSPILITNGNKLNEQQKSFIKSIKEPNFYFLGGDAVMKYNLLEEVQSLFDLEISKIRLYGEDRQETNGVVLDYCYDENINNLIVCKSDNLIDALCVGVFAGKNNIPVLIATKDLSSMQEDVVKYKSYDTLYEVGGGISSKVISGLK